jgi:hypothetical protein
MLLVLFPGLLVLSASGETLEKSTSPIIKNIGEGTAYIVPSHVEFWIHCKEESHPIELAMTQAVDFREDLEKQLEREKIAPLEVEHLSPAVTDMDTGEVRVSSRLRFSMSKFTQHDAGAMLFADLCDTLKTIAANLNARVDEPVLLSSKENNLAQQAVVIATENALDLANAVAETLLTSVYSVEEVEILGLTWNKTPRFKGVEPNIRQIACTARVKVTYAVVGQP